MKSNKPKPKINGLKLDLTNIHQVEFEKSNNKLSVSTQKMVID